MNIKFTKQLVAMSRVAFVTILVNICLASTLIASNSSGQSKSMDEIFITVHAENESVEKVLDHIRSLTNFYFSYYEEDIAGKTVTLHADQKSLTDILKTISRQANLSFKRIDENINVFRPKQKAMVEDSYKANSEKILVTGMVTSSDDKLGLPGVNIVIKGTVIGTVTNTEGKYAIEVPSQESVLVFSSIGYATVERVVGSQTEINVELSVDITTLEEVVVVDVGYGTQKKVDVTGAVGSLSSAEIEKAAPITIDQALQGRVAGVQMTTNTGLPGGGVSIQIRGLNSINYSNEPIYVIDGVIVNTGTGSYTTNPFSALSPSDIESIDVLKDASAAAIYGAQGANGVIIITTKRGKEGKPRVVMNAQYSRQYIPKHIDMANLREYAQHQNELYTLRGWGINPLFADPSVLSAGTNWQKEIFTPAAMKNYDFSISGGSSETKYKFAGSYLDQDGIAAGSGFKRLYVSSNLDSKINSWLKGGLSLTFTNTDQIITITDWSLINSALRQSPSVPARNLDGTYGGPEDPNDALSNPLALARLIDRGNGSTGGRGNLYFEVTPVKWLTVRSEVAADINAYQARTFVPTYKLGNRENSQIENSKTINYSSFLTSRTWATAKYKFYDKHDVSFMLGFEANERNSNNLSGQRYGGSNQLTDLNAGDAATATNSNYTSRTAFVSYFGRLFYSYDDRYMLTATLRRDASSLLAPGHRWNAFPSASAAWRISKESFFTVPAINDLKLRLGYGQTGNSNIPAFSYSANLANVPTIWGTGYLVANVPNRDVTWERSSSYNIGLDVGLFTNRLQLVMDVYKKTTDNLLLAVTGPGTSGAAGGLGSTSPPIDNVGSMENKGIELSLNTINIDRNGFRWTSNFVYTRNINKVLDLHTATANIYRYYQVNGTQYIVSRTQTGGSLGDFYGYKMVGRINSATDLYDSEGNQKIAIPENQIVAEDNGIWVGDLIWDDYNGDGVINEEDRQYLGSPLPVFTYGVGNTLSYKNFDFNVFLNGSYGNKILNFLAISIDNPNETSVTSRAALDYARLGLIDPEGSLDDIYNVYVESGDSDLPRMSVNDVNTNRRLSSRFIEDGSYLRIQNVSLAYNAPKTLLSRYGLQSLKFTLSVRNLYTFTKYSGYDPEVGMLKDQYTNYSQDATRNGIDVGRYPSPRIYSIGLSVGL